jgi:hypothetical protein
VIVTRKDSEKFLSYHFQFLTQDIRYINTVGYARTNVIGSTTSFVTISVRSSVH